MKNWSNDMQLLAYLITLFVVLVLTVVLLSGKRELKPAPCYLVDPPSYELAPE